MRDSDVVNYANFPEISKCSSIACLKKAKFTIMYVQRDGLNQIVAIQGKMKK